MSVFALNLNCFFFKTKVRKDTVIYPGDSNVEVDSVVVIPRVCDEFTGLVQGTACASNTASSAEPHVRRRDAVSGKLSSNRTRLKHNSLLKVMFYNVTDKFRTRFSVEIKSDYVYCSDVFSKTLKNFCPENL
jgi:hypothetical protein